jgi:hypothetical protein
MFRNPLKMRKIGYVLAGFAVLGMLFSLLSIGGIWILRPGLTKSASNLVGMTHETLMTTQTAVGFLSGSVSQVNEDLALIQSSLDSLESSMASMADSLATSANLIGDDLSLTLSEVQTAVSSASTSAEFIDNTLAFIASIPLIGADYQPDTPLHISLGKIADDLGDIPESLTSLESSLNSASTDLQSFSDDLAVLSDDLDIVLEDLSGSQDILAEYNSILSEAIQKVNGVETRLKLYSLLTSMFLTGMLLWLGISQFGVYLQALDYIHFDDKIVSLSDLDRE